MVTMSKRRASAGSWSGVSVRALTRSSTTTRGSVRSSPVELAVADVERDDAGGAPLQQDVGEAAGRRADVERHPALRRRRRMSRARAPA